jgi:hypothetical protein
MRIKESIYTDCNGNKCLFDAGIMRYSDDYFAGQALISLIGKIDRNTTKSDQDLIPNAAYYFADAMIEDRNK